jgi:hypothetical protein
MLDAHSVSTQLDAPAKTEKRDGKSGQVLRHIAIRAL